MKKSKSALIINFEYIAALVLIYLLRRLSLRSAYLLSSVLMRALFLIDTLHRRRTVQHILHSGIVSGRKEAVELARRNFIHFGKVLVEIFKMHQIINKDNYREHIRLSGPKETYDYVFGSHTPTILVTAHCGNWEVAGMCYTLLSGMPLLSVKRLLSNPRLGELVFRERETYEHEGCKKEGALKALLKGLKHGKSIAILADQHASTSEGVETVFFGHPARTHASPALLHLKTGAPILVAITRRVDDDFHFEYIVKEPIIMKPGGNMEEDIKKLTQLYTSQLEEMIRAYPEQWLWSHRRWLDINRKKRNSGT